MPTVSIVMPVYNVEDYVAASIQSVLNQIFTDFELLIINDGATDNSLKICQQFDDSRIKIIQQSNRGLAGARNTGIRHAQSKYIALLDADDLWTADKLEKHVTHLNNCPEVGISFSISAFIDDNGQSLDIYMLPDKFSNITAANVLCHNPIGNGSAPVIRKAVFEEIGFSQHLHNVEETAYFDETFKQFEDIECWLRIAIQTKWQFECLSEALTLYRVNTGGSSVNLEKQYAQWERIIDKNRGSAPDFFAKWEKPARAYQLCYLARGAIRQGDARVAIRLIHKAITTYYQIIFQEPARSLVTLMAAYALLLLPKTFFQWLRACNESRIGKAKK